jgi:hypothetical protein
VSVIVLALLIGWVADLLFYGKALGISVPIFALLLVGALFGVGFAERIPFARRNVWIVLPLFFFAVMVAVRANFFLTVLNVLMCGCLLLLLAYYFTGGHLHRLGIFGYPLIMLVAFFEVLGRTATLIYTALERRTATRSSAVASATGRTALPWFSLLRGALIALPVLALFAALLASADAVFASYISSMFNLSFLEDAPEMLWRLVIILTIAWLVAGGLAYALRPVAEERSSHVGLDVPAPRALGSVETATVLVAVNLLFLAFVVIQFAYLFAGRTLTTLEDSDYKHYARRGFGELIAVSVLTMGMILLLRWLARFDSPAQLRLFNILSTVMVGLSLVILTSAWLRMFYWEEVSDYISTSLRLYVRVFIVWLALAFLWLVAVLWVRPTMFAVGAFVAAIGYLGTLDVMNPDDNVVRYNIARASTRELYFPYLHGLSEDAVPALVDGLNALPPGGQRDALAAELSSRLAQMNKDPNRGVWQSFNWSRASAYDELSHMNLNSR